MTFWQVICVVIMMHFLRKAMHSVAKEEIKAAEREKSSKRMKQE